MAQRDMKSAELAAALSAVEKIKRGHHPRGGGYMKTKAVVAALLVTLSAHAHDPKDEVRYVFGAGGFSCGKFLDHNPPQVHADMFWVHGYVAGTRLYDSNDPPPSTPDFAGWKQFVINYCKEHPLDKLAQAATALIQELEKRGQ